MKLLFIAIFVLATGILSVECKGRVYNGNIAVAEEFRYQVEVLIQVWIQNQAWALRCGGSIIGEEWILSAAHCFYGYDVRSVNISLGLKVNNAFIQKITAVSVIIHEGFQILSDSALNDIALVKIPKVEYMKRYIRIIPLCNSYLVDGTDVIVSGFGLINNETYATELRYAHLVLNSTACNTLLPAALDPSLICTYEKTRNACSGDSGGPLVVGYGNSAMQVGLLSYGFERCSPDLPAVFTRISAFVPWIQNKTNFAIRTKRCI